MSDNEAIGHTTAADVNVLEEVGASPEYIAKADLALRIRKTVEQMGLNQKQAAAVMGISQPRYSKIRAGNFDEISREKLEDCLRHLGHDLVLVVRPRHEGVGTRTVVEEPAQLTLVQAPTMTHADYIANHLRRTAGMFPKGFLASSVSRTAFIDGFQGLVMNMHDEPTDWRAPVAKHFAGPDHLTLPGTIHPIWAGHGGVGEKVTQDLNYLSVRDE